MNERTLRNRYFEWLCRLVENEEFTKGYSYEKLLALLHETVFDYYIPMDSNREMDGIDLRYRFGEEYGYEQPMIATILDIYPCSVLEMMCALAVRCEEAIMSDPDKENRVGLWFWIMIKNLGLESMDDDNFARLNAERIIHRFLNRDYNPNGEGGLFVVNNRRCDLRDVEIWNQMCWFLDEYLNI